MSATPLSSPVPIISPVPDDTLEPQTEPPGGFVQALRADPQASSTCCSTLVTGTRSSSVAAHTILVSSLSGGGKYNIPHLLAMETVRKVRQPSTTSSADREPDYALG